MKKYLELILAGGLAVSILISNGIGIIRDGRRLDRLRGSVLRLHILADSDTKYAQSLKLKVRDGLLEANLFESAESLADAEKTVAENIDAIEKKAEDILQENGCYLPVSAELADVVFDERVYEDITMPAGEYRALRVKIGSAQGKNWWCVMYPPLCLPVACTVDSEKKEDTEKIKDSDNTAEKDDTKTVRKNASAEKFFNDSEKDILHYPEKYEIRFAVWDKIKEMFGDKIVKDDEK